MKHTLETLVRSGMEGYFWEKDFERLRIAFLAIDIAAMFAITLIKQIDEKLGFRLRSVAMGEVSYKV